MVNVLGLYAVIRWIVDITRHINKTNIITQESLQLLDNILYRLCHFDI